MPLHKELRRDHIELFRNLFPDLDQLGSALLTGTRRRLMPLFDPRQPIRERGAFGNALRWRLLGLGFRLLRSELALSGRNIGFELRLPQRQLLHVELLRLHAKAPAAQPQKLEL